MLRAAASWHGSKYSLLDLLGGDRRQPYATFEGEVVVDDWISLLLELALRLLVPRIRAAALDVSLATVLAIVVRRRHCDPCEVLLGEWCA